MDPQKALIEKKKKKKRRENQTAARQHQHQHQHQQGSSQAGKQPGSSQAAVREFPKLERVGGEPESGWSNDLIPATAK